MKRFLPFIFLLWALQTFCQEPLDSTFWEMEDSVSAMAIRPIEKPKELLMRIFERLMKDVQQKHSRRDYKMEAAYNISAPPSLYVRQAFTVEGDDGIAIYRAKCERGPMQLEGPYRITKQDSSKILFSLALEFGHSMHMKSLRNIGEGFESVGISYLFSHYKLGTIYRAFMKEYNVKVYSIGDASGRGVYRIELEEKKSRKDPYRKNLTLIEKWYFDQESLRLTQINLDYYSKERRTRVQYDYGEEMGSPVMTKYTYILVLNKRLMHKTTITLTGK